MEIYCRRKTLYQPLPQLMSIDNSCALRIMASSDNSCEWPVKGRYFRTIPRNGGSMSEANDQNCNCRNLFADQETWEIILDPAFCNDPGAADCLAHLLFVLKKAIPT